MQPPLGSHTLQFNAEHPPFVNPAFVSVTQLHVEYCEYGVKPGSAAHAHQFVTKHAKVAEGSMHASALHVPPLVKVPELTAQSEGVLVEQVAPLQQRPVAQQEQDI
jgi:hypothetical protein